MRKTMLWAATLGVLALTAAGCSSATTGAGAPAAPLAKRSTVATSPSATASTASSAAGSPVHVSLLESDGGTYGVGMPIVAYFSQNITDPACVRPGDHRDGERSSGERGVVFRGER